MRNKSQFLKYFLPPFLSSWVQLHFWILYLLPHNRHRVMGHRGCRWGLCHSLLNERIIHTLPSFQCGVSPTGQSSMNFSNTSSFPSFQFFTARVSHRVTNPAIKLLRCGLFSSRVHRSCHTLLWLRLPMGSRPGILHGLQVDISSTVGLHGLQGDSSLTMVLTKATLPCKSTFLTGNSGKSKEEKVRAARAAGWCSASWGFQVVVKHSWCLKDCCIKS